MGAQDRPSADGSSIFGATVNDGKSTWVRTEAFDTGDPGEDAGRDRSKICADAQAETEDPPRDEARGCRECSGSGIDSGQERETAFARSRCFSAIVSCLADWSS
jgi:hypothetical protein